MSQLESAGEQLSGHEELSRPVREGLPSSYRMRADAHYVDLLTSRPTGGRERTLPPRDIESPPLAERSLILPLVDSIARHGVLQPLLIQNHQGRYRLIAGHKRLSAAVAMGLPEVPCRLFDVDDEEAARLASAAALDVEAVPAGDRAGSNAPGIEADLEKSLTSLAACTDLLSGVETGLSRDVAQTLLRAEIWRAASLVKAAQVLKQDTDPIRTTVRLSTVLEQVAAGFAPERKLQPFELQFTRSSPDDAILVTNERLLVVAVSCAVRVVLDICGTAGAIVKIGAKAAPDNLLTFTVSHSMTALSGGVLSRAFDPDWTDRPGGHVAFVTSTAVRHAAALLGGRAEIGSVDRATGIIVTIAAGF